MPEKLDSAAREKLDSAAQIVGEAVGTIKVAIAVVAARVRQGLREAAAIIGASTTADRIGQRSHPIRKMIRQKAVSAKNRIRPTWRDASEATDATEKRTAPTVRQGRGAEKTARKRAAPAGRNAGVAKKTAQKRAAPAGRKVSGTKKAATPHR
jgi:hypothetical protein